MNDGQRRRVLVVGHTAGAELFGAERSLLDLLDGFTALDIDTVVLVPPTGNTDYLAQLRERSTAVHIMPIRPTWPRRPVTDAEIEAVLELVDLHDVHAVHVNTVVPQEALLAARRRGIPAVVHARELPFGDPDLWHWLGLDDAESLIASVLAEADYVVAVSRAVAATFPLPNATAVVPNSVDVRLFPERPESTTGHTRVALVGSTTQRKGLLEFVAIARLLSHRSDLSCVVVGPISELVVQLRATVGLPANLEFVGYVPGPQQAMALADVIVNLSVCREASGRTVMEAAAAGLPVVAFGHGGIPEVVTDGVTGFLVPPGDCSMAAQRIEQLADDHQLQHRMGGAGREFVRVHHSPDALAGALGTVYRAILPSPAASAAAANDIVIPLPWVNRTDHREMYFAGNRARYSGCTSVRFVDDNRVVAASLLGQEMHLIRLDLIGGIGEIVSTLRTTDGERDVSVDLIDFDGGTQLVTANCEHSSVSMYRVEGNELSFVDAQLAGGSDMAYCHGTAFVPSQLGAIASALTTGVPRVEFLTGQGPAIAPFINDGWRPKSVAFIGSLMVVGSVRHNNAVVPRSVNFAQLALVELDAGGAHRVLDVVEYEGSVDGCYARGSVVYLANQTQDSVVVFEVVAGRLHRQADIEGFSLPHDVAVSPDGRWLAVASYGDNAVHVRRLVHSGSQLASGSRRGWSLRRWLRGRR